MYTIYFIFRFKDRNDNGEKVGGTRCIRNTYAIEVIDWLDGDSLLYLFCERMPESISCEANICPRAMQIARGDILANAIDRWLRDVYLKKRIFIEYIRGRSYFSLSLIDN